MNEDFIAVDGIFSDGYGFIPKKLMRDKRLTSESKAIYAYLSSFAGAGMTSYPSVSLMMSELGMSKDRFYKHRKLLIDFGYVEIVQKKDKESQFSKNVYFIKTKLPSPCFKDTENPYTGNEDTENKDTNSNSSNSNSLNSNSNNPPIPPEGDSGDLPKTPKVEQKPKPPKPEKPKKEPKPDTYSEKFEQWWSVYPRKTAKGTAWNRWKKDKLESRAEDLIEKITQQVAMQYAFTETRYIPNASTYLNQKRYDDEIENKGVKNGIATNTNGNQRKESTMDRARREQREFLASLDEEPTQRAGEDLGFHD